MSSMVSGLSSTFTTRLMTRSTKTDINAAVINNAVARRPLMAPCKSLHTSVTGSGRWKMTSTWIFKPSRRILLLRISTQLDIRLLQLADLRPQEKRVSKRPYPSFNSTGGRLPARIIHAFRCGKGGWRYGRRYSASSPYQPTLDIITIQHIDRLIEIDEIIAHYGAQHQYTGSGKDGTRQSTLRDTSVSFQADGIHQMRLTFTRKVRKMNIGLNWVVLGCSAITIPTERGGLWLSPSI